MPAGDNVYRAAFERLWDQHSTQTVPNVKPENSAALIAVFLEKAKSDVVIFCRELKPEIYDQPYVLSALDRILADPKVRLDVVVQTQLPAGSKFAAKLAATKSDRISFFHDVKEPARSYLLNFAYADSHAYRFEKDNGSAEPTACAWGESTVMLLEKVYGQLKKGL